VRWLVTTSLRLPAIVVALAILLVVVGLQATRTAPYDVFPEFAPPLVEIQTEAPGLSTEEVEALVTVPLERALNGTAWLATLRSKSVLGLSSVVLLFEDGTDLMQARQLVQERVALVATRLPAVAKPPVMLAPLSSTSRAMKIGMTSQRLSQMELTDLALWVIRPRLMAIPGVANVAVWGQRDRQLQVLVTPDRLRAHGVTLDAVTRAAAAATAVGAGGFVDTPSARLPVRYVSGVTAADDLAGTVVEFRGGAALRLGDVASVGEGAPAPIGDAVVNDQPGLLLIVEKQPWGNTLAVTRNVDAALEALKPGLAGVDLDTGIFRPATFIERALRNLGRAMGVGCVLVALVLVVFLRDWRTAVISVIAIPLSLLGAVVVLRAWGASIDTMVLAGLVIAVGEVVDDAIIDVENIARRLRLNRTAAAPRSPFAVVLDASLEVRSAVVFASLVVMLVFLPVFFLGGLAGAFFRPLATAYVLAILASLLVALTVTPALALLLIPGAARGTAEPGRVTDLKRRYHDLLVRVLATSRRSLVVLVVTALLVTGIVARSLGEEFLPNFKETDFLMHFVEKPGTSLEAMRRVTLEASRALRAIPGVQSFGAHIGRAEVADEVVGPNFTELWISIAEDVDYAATVARIGTVVGSFAGLYRDVLTYLRERIKEVLTGASATVVVRIFGPELAGLRAQAATVRDAIHDVPGIADLKVETQVLVPQLEVRPRPELLERLGLTPAAVQRAASTLVQGVTVGQVYRDQRSIDVRVWGSEVARSDIAALQALAIETPGGGHVRLGEVADVVVVPAPNEIKREGASRRIDVLCNVAGRDLGGVARDIETRVGALPFPTGYHAELLGEHAARAQAQRRLLALSALAVAGIILLLHADFRSMRLTLLVVVSLPFALVGGVMAALLGGGVLSLGSLVGFVTVLGIAARNGIMLVSHYRHLEQEEGEPFGPALVLRGAEERLVPILMTALCASLALFPLVIAGEIPGHEIEHPMAIVILGGLVTSTALNLLLMPALYLGFGHVSGLQKASV
jgi:CzcA family heavy metal efflux pump